MLLQLLPFLLLEGGAAAADPTTTRSRGRCRRFFAQLPPFPLVAVNAPDEIHHRARRPQRPFSRLARCLDLPTESARQ